MSDTTTEQAGAADETAFSSREIDKLAALAKAQGNDDRFAEAPVVQQIARTFYPNPGRNGSTRLPLLLLFLEKVAFGASDCWYWRGSLSHLGYGATGRNPYGEVKAHRVAWTLFKGPIPSGMLVLHRCDVRSCVNPEHLFLGTQTDNMRDMSAKGRGGNRSLYGEENPRSRLTAETVRQARAAYARGGRSMSQLAAEHGVSTMTICRAINRQSWKEVQ